MSPTRSIAVSTLWQLGSQIVMAALSIVTVKLVVLGLDKELYGIYNSSYGYLQLFGILADFGLYAVAVREVSRSPDPSKTLGATMVLRWILLAFSLIVALVIAWILPQWRGTPLPLGIAIASLVPFCTLLAGVLRTTFQINYKLHYVFIAEVTQRIVSTGLIAVAVAWGVRNATDVRWTYAFLLTGGIGAFVLLLLSMIFSRGLLRPSFAFPKEEMLRIAKLAAPFGAAYLCIAIYRQLDVTLIAMLRPDFELQNAEYGTVVRMTDMAYLLPTFLLNSTLPILSKRHAAKEDTRSMAGKALLTVLLLGTITFLFASLWSRPLSRLLTSDEYLSTATSPGTDTALFLQALPMLLNGIILYAFYALLTTHAWRRLLMTLALGALLSLILNIVLIPEHGFVGACITAIVVHGLLAASLLPQALKAMPAALPKTLFLRAGLFSAVVAVCLWAVRPLLTNDLRTAGMLAAMGIVLLLLGAWTGIGRAMLGTAKEGQETGI